MSTAAAPSPLSLSAPAVPLAPTREPEPERYPLDGATLARWCGAAAAAVLRGGHDRSREQRKRNRGSEGRAVTVNGRALRAVKPDASSDEIDALAQETALRVISTHGPAPCRSRVGVSYLRTVAHGIATEDGAAGRGWLDSAESYRSRAAAARGDSAMIRRMPEDSAADDSADPLVREIARRTAVAGSPLPVIPADALELAERVAEALALDGLTAGDARAVTVALLRAGMTAEGDESAPLARIAADRGCSLVTAKRDSARGAAVLRDRVPAAVLAATVASVADGMRAVLPPDPYRPTLSAAQMGALLAVESAKPAARVSAARGARGGSVLPGAVPMGSTRPLRFARAISGTVRAERVERAKRAAAAKRRRAAWAAWERTLAERAAEGQAWAVQTLAAR